MNEFEKSKNVIKEYFEKEILNMFVLATIWMMCAIQMIWDKQCLSRISMRPL